MVAKVQHLGSVSYFLMYWVALLWMLSRVVWLMAFTKRRKLREGTR